MSKPKTTKKKATAKTRKPAAKATAATPPAEPKVKAPREDLCVFAFRLTPAERDTPRAGKRGHDARHFEVAHTSTELGFPTCRRTPEPPERQRLIADHHVP